MKDERETSDVSCSMIVIEEFTKVLKNIELSNLIIEINEIISDPNLQNNETEQ